MRERADLGLRLAASARRTNGSHACVRRRAASAPGLGPGIPGMPERLRLDAVEQRALLRFEARADGRDGAARALHRLEAREDTDRAVLVAQQLRLQDGNLLHAPVAADRVVADSEHRHEMLDALADALQRNLRARELELIERAQAEIRPAHQPELALRVARVRPQRGRECAIARERCGWK